MKIKVTREVENECSEEIQRELNRFNGMDENWLKKYVDVCNKLSENPVVVEMTKLKADLFQLSRELRSENRTSHDQENGQELMWAASNLESACSKVNPDNEACDKYHFRFRSWRPPHGESHVENPVVLASMLMQEYNYTKVHNALETYKKMRKKKNDSERT